jgi:hypothetical protein
VAYLREPITQGFQHEFRGPVPIDSIFDPEKDATTRNSFTRLADQAFAGIPPKGVADVIDSLDPFALRGRRLRTLLIKEVNPLAADFLVRRYAARIVLILRHPAAVADSFRRMGWLKDEFEAFGYEYGTHLAQAITASGKSSLTKILYEDLAGDPRAQFLQLFAELALRPPAKYETIIHEYCEEAKLATGPYEIRRSSQNEIHKWRHNLSAPQVSAVKNGYLRSALQYYREEGLWRA